MKIGREMDKDSYEFRNPNELGLQQTRQQFRILADWAPVSMALFDINMRYLELSQGWRDDCQIGDRNVIGVSHYEIFPDLPERWKEVHRRCLQGATERSESDLFVRPDGTTGWLRWEVKPWRDNFGNIAGIVMWSEDITARVTAQDIVQDSERRFRAALANSKIAVWEQDLQLRYTWIYNPKLGYEAAAVIGKTDAELMEPAYAKVIEAIKRRVIETGQASREEVVTAAPGGKLECFDLQVDPLRNDAGHIIGVTCAASDISQRKEAEETLRILVSEKEALLKEVHHRVKNNMQVISSLLHLESGRSTVNDTKAVLDDMQARIRTMALLHESLYRSNTFASIELGSYLRQVAMQSFEAHELNAGAVQLELNLDHVQVGLDQAITCGLLVNELISNCFRHGFPAGLTGHVSIELQPCDTAKQWRLCLSDTGVGLPADFEEKRKNSLGLELVAVLARQMGGKLTIASKQGKGASFNVSFQAVGPEPLPMESQNRGKVVSNHSTAPKPQILIVEDESIIAMDICNQLRDLGYEPLGPARTGEQAIEMASRLRPRLVLMDIHLGSQMDGIVTAQQIRTQFEIPCVFLSAFSGDESQTRAKLTNPAGYLAKPFSANELRMVMAAALAEA